MIDLRSDTVTLPTVDMRTVMANAEVGDDVYGEDPTVNQLEKTTAALLDKEAGLFVPSGTMSNQLAIMTATRPGDAIILESTAHIGRYEAGGPAVLSGVTLSRVCGTNGILSADDIWSVTDQPEDVHCTPVSLVAVENTANVGGGTVYPLNVLMDISSGARQRGLWSHCDGARLWNAAIASGHDEATLVRDYDSVSVCLSKGLGAPMGSVLVGPRDFIKTARRFRKMLGGGMRQAGVVAAAGLHALTHHRSRLAQDHDRTNTLAVALKDQGWQLQRPQTNMVYISVPDPSKLIDKTRAHGVLISPVGPQKVRIVLHLDIDDSDINTVISVMSQIASLR